MSILCEKYLKNLVVAAFLSATIFVFVPSHIYLTNYVEFSFGFSQLLYLLLPVALGLALLLGLALSFTPLRESLRQKITVTLFAIGFLLWMQGNLLVWNYGIFDGSPIHWVDHWWQWTIDGLVWVAFLLFAWHKSAYLLKKVAPTLSLFLIGLQLVTLVTMYFKLPPDQRQQTYVIDNQNRFSFSKDKNVVILLLDGFQSDVFQEIINSTPKIQDQLQGFTYFRNAVCGLPCTFGSVPNILTGEYYDNSVLMTKFIRSAYRSSYSLPKRLKSSGYVVDLFPLPYIEKAVDFNSDVMSNLTQASQLPLDRIAYILDASIFRVLPGFLRPFIFNDNKWLLQQYAPRFVNNKDVNPQNQAKKIVSQFPAETQQLYDVSFMEHMANELAVKYDAPVFKYFHLVGAHEPFNLNEKLQYEEMPASRENYKRQAQAKLQMSSMFLDLLRRNGIYDNTMIFIIADHGSLFPVQSKLSGRDGKTTGNDGMPPKSIPLVLVKPFKSQGSLKVSDAPVCLSDIPATVFKELQIQAPPIGESMFDVKENESRPRKHYNLFWDGANLNYFPIMTEYQVDGFSWLNDSWHKTGRVFLPKADDASADFEKFLNGNKHLGTPQFYTNLKGGKPTWYFSDVENKEITMHFQDQDPVQGDLIGLRVQLRKLQKNKRYELAFEIKDPYGLAAYPDHFVQQVYVKDKLIWQHDIGNDKFEGWNKLAHRFTADHSNVELRIEVKATGPIEKGFQWGLAARANVRNLTIDELGQ